jgi:hypothetical protein
LEQWSNVAERMDYVVAIRDSVVDRADTRIDPGARESVCRLDLLCHMTADEFEGTGIWDEQYAHHLRAST